MKKNKIIISIFVLLLSLTLVTGVVSAQEGTIQGYVRNSEGESIRNLSVYLESSENMSSNFNTSKTIKTNETGYYKFSGLNTSNLFRVKTEYKNNTFYAPGLDMPGGISDLITFMTANSTTINSNITVYNGTSNRENLEISTYHLVVEYMNTTNNLNVIQLFEVNNTGDRAFVGDLTISAPDNATNTEGELIKNQTFSLTLGANESEQKRFQYQIPFSNGTRFIQSVDIETKILYVLFDSSSLNGTNPSNLMDLGQRNLQGRNYYVYVAGMSRNLSAGEKIGLTLNEAEKTQSPSDKNEGSNGLLIPGIILGAIILLVIFYLRKKEISLPNKKDFGTSKQESTSEKEEISDQEIKRLKRRKKSLLKKIDELDKKYEEAEISEERYEQKRKNYKEDVRKVMKKLGSVEDQTVNETEGKSELEEKKEELLHKINDLDKRLERENISEEEHGILREKYKKKLKEIMEELEN